MWDLSALFNCFRLHILVSGASVHIYFPKIWYLIFVKICIYKTWYFILILLKTMLCTTKIRFKLRFKTFIMRLRLLKDVEVLRDCDGNKKNYRLRRWKSFHLCDSLVVFKSLLKTREKKIIEPTVWLLKCWYTPASEIHLSFMTNAVFSFMTNPTLSEATHEG